MQPRIRLKRVEDRLRSAKPMSANVKVSKCIASRAFLTTTFDRLSIRVSTQVSIVILRRLTSNLVHYIVDAHRLANPYQRHTSMVTLLHWRSDILYGHGQPDDERILNRLIAGGLFCGSCSLHVYSQSSWQDHPICFVSWYLLS